MKHQYDDSFVKNYPLAYKLLTILLTFAVGLPCGLAVTPNAPQQLSPNSMSPVSVAHGARGAVATAHPLATEAAIKTLAAGGNAVDAAIAASLVISVVRPQSTGIGGGGFALVYDPKGSQMRAYDFRERAPAGARKDMYIHPKTSKPIDFSYQKHRLKYASVNGHLAVATPGLVRGLVDLHKNHGTQDFAKLCQPAIDIAEQGFEVYPALHSAIEGRKEIVEAFEDTRALFMSQGKVLKAGDLLVQKDLANTLKRIAATQGEDFYSGQTAKKIIEEMNRGQGILSAKDLKDYKTIERKPVEGVYKNHRIIAMPPPSSGGVHMIQMLNMLADDKLDRKQWGEAGTVHLIAEVMRRAFRDRSIWMGDPDFVSIPLKGLLSKDYAEVMRSEINSMATPSKKLVPSQAQLYESPSTTHISIVDGQGMAFSSTQTINYTLGSGVIAQGTGIVLNNEMDDFSIAPGIPNAYGLVGAEANSIAPGKTMLSSMTPAIILDQHDKVHMVLGSPGGPRIINATFLVVLHALGFGMPIDEAVSAGRLHHQFLPDVLKIERSRLPDQQLQNLKSMGHTIDWIESVGDVQAIQRQSDGQGWIAVSDHRSDGKAGAL